MLLYRNPRRADHKIQYNSHFDTSQLLMRSPHITGDQLSCNPFSIKGISHSSSWLIMLIRILMFQLLFPLILPFIIIIESAKDY